MHADKISAKKRKQSFLMNPQVFDLSLLFSLKFTEGHLIVDREKIYPRSKIKTDIKNHEKSHFKLTTGPFLFSKYKTIKGLH
jgi:hypothetical protein